MFKSLASLSVLFAFTACAQQRYEWSLAHQFLSAKMQKMPASDIREITRLVSEHCALPIYCIHQTGRNKAFPDEVWVVAANSVSMDSSRNGLYRLRKEGGSWHIIEGGLGLSTSLIICDDG